MKSTLKSSLLGFVLACGPLRAESAPPAAHSGGACTQFNAGREAFSLPLANISRENRRKFVVGNAFFNENWIIAPGSPEARDGLGPLFHARSCSGCHTKDGRGDLPAAGDVMTGLLLRLSIPGADSNGGPRPDPVYGGQLGVRAIPGAEPEADAAITWEEQTVRFADGEAAVLRKPVFRLSNWRYGEPDKSLMVGPRLAPPVFGGGLLEAIPESSLLAAADPDDQNKDGISGRPNWVWNAETKKKSLGRFGWKANQPDLRHQAAGAFLGDMGLRTSLLPDGDFTAAQAPKLEKLPHGGNPEVSDLIFDRVVTYLHALAPPARRDVADAEALRGEALFATAGCVRCHVPAWTTAKDAPMPELANQTIRPHTDLLLHDMGEGLADGRPDFAATGAEWRTAPLWGIGLSQIVNGSSRLLHDGRAASIQEAILWHGGEAQPARESFRAMSKADRAALLKFLHSL
jgi:CxxC motif-containing protein (DUF1111 family)